MGLHVNEIPFKPTNIPPKMKLTITPKPTLRLIKTEKSVSAPIPTPRPLVQRNTILQGLINSSKVIKDVVTNNFKRVEKKNSPSLNSVITTYVKPTLVKVKRAFNLGQGKNYRYKIFHQQKSK